MVSLIEMILNKQTGTIEFQYTNKAPQKSVKRFLKCFIIVFLL